jgi:hypothetical protein
MPGDATPGIEDRIPQTTGSQNTSSLYSDFRFFARTEVALCCLSGFNADSADASSICAVAVIGDRPIVADYVVLKANEKNNDNVKEDTERL